MTVDLSNISNVIPGEGRERVLPKYLRRVSEGDKEERDLEIHPSCIY